ncbi:MAG: hypothetical protein ACREIA_24650, partial [Opitutaceae bacterium]
IGTAADRGDRDRDDRYDDDRRYRRDYSDRDYMRLLTSKERAILRARAEDAGRDDDDLTDFLTSEEKENLRRRDLANRTIE